MIGEDGNQGETWDKGLSRLDRQVHLRRMRFSPEGKTVHEEIRRSRDVKIAGTVLVLVAVLTAVANAANLTSAINALQLRDTTLDLVHACVTLLTTVLLVILAAQVSRRFQNKTITLYAPESLVDDMERTRRNLVRVKTDPFLVDEFLATAWDLSATIDTGVPDDALNRRVRGVLRYITKSMILTAGGDVSTLSTLDRN